MFNSGAKGRKVADTNDNVKINRQTGSLLGRFSHRLDPKRRIMIPSTLRNRMACPDYVYVMPDLSGLKCLNIFAPDEIESRLAKLRAAALTDKRTSDFVSSVGAISETLDVDTQGRIRICDSLLKRIGIVRELVLIGAFNRIQVWSMENAPAEKDAFESFAEAARELGF